jgi:hypothetical protein
MDAVTVLVEQTQIAPHRVLGGLSATLTLPDYGRVARHPLRITTASQSFQKRSFSFMEANSKLSPDSPERIVLEIDMIRLIDSEGAKS